MPRQIIVPLDGSSLSTRAIPVAAALARHHHATLHLVQVLLPPTRLFAGQGQEVPTYVEEVREATDRELARIARRVRRASQIEVHHHLRTGEITEEILALVREVHGDLVVLTSHGRGGLSRAWLGSITDRLIRELPVPVLVARQRMDASALAERGVPFTRVLVPVDGGADAEALVTEVMELLGDVPATLTLAHIISPSPVMLANLEDSTAVHAIERDYLQPLAAKLARAPFQFRTVVLTANSAARAIADLAKAEEVELIAMRTHGRHGLPRLTLGSVTDKVLRLTTRPVWIRGPSHS